MKASPEQIEPYNLEAGITTSCVYNTYIPGSNAPVVLAVHDCGPLRLCRKADDLENCPELMLLKAAVRLLTGEDRVCEGEVKKKE